MGVSSAILVLALLLISVLQVYTATDAPTPTPYNNSNTTQSCRTDIGVGYSFILFIPAILLGSNYVLLKRYNDGDGVFFQWMVSVGVWICGLVVHLIHPSPHFYPPAILGGVIWSGGNFLLIPMIRLVGFNTGVLMWSLVFMSSGWSTGFIDLIGVPHKKLCIPFFNYGGLVMCGSGVILLAFLKELHVVVNKHDNDTAYNKLYNVMMLPNYLIQDRKLKYNVLFGGLVRKLVSKLSPFKKKVIGYVLSLLMGVAWGTHFLPMRVLQTLATRNPYYSPSSLHYIFPYVTGVFITSSLLTTIYSVYMRNTPRIVPKSLLPALTVGVLTGTAISLWAFLDEKMTSAVTFPVIASGTPIIGFLWGIIAYRGWKNLLIFLVSVCVILSGITLVLLSNIYPFPIYPSLRYGSIRFKV